MNFRDAVLEDCLWILECRNDPETRSQSFNTDLVEEEAHHSWFHKGLKNPARKLIIAEANGQRIGILRYDRVSETEAELSINIAPSHRGMGQGVTILSYSAGLAKAWNNNLVWIVAYVKVNNIASLKSFQKAGYIQSEESNGTAKFVLRL